MAQHARRRPRGRKPSGEEGADGFMTAPPEDHNWMEALRDEFADASDWDPAGPREDADQDPPSGMAAVQVALDEQRDMILSLVARVEALEASLTEVVRRVPTSPEPSPAPAGPPQATVRGVLATLLAESTGTASRLGAAMERRRGKGPGV